MRIADKMAYNQVTANLQKNRGEMSELQNQAATQKRITKPSDDPTASSRVLAARTEQRGAEQFVKNINVARSFLEASDQSMTELTELLVRAKELAIQQASDAGASAETRRTVAAELEQIFDQTVQVGNRKLGDRYIFSGYKTNSPPFDLSGDYHGDDGDMKIQINKDAYISMNVPGNKLLLGIGVGEDGLIRSSPITPKTVEDVREIKAQDMRKQIELEEQKEDPMALRAPTSTSRDNKTYESVVGPQANGVNILRVLKDFEIGLRTGDKEEIQASIDRLDSALSQIINARAQVGARVSALISTTDTLQRGVVDHKITASQLEDADLFQVMSDMTKSDSTLKATLETSGKVVNMSLLDFLK